MEKCAKEILEQLPARSGPKSDGAAAVCRAGAMADGPCEHALPRDSVGNGALQALLLIVRQFEEEPISLALDPAHALGRDDFVGLEHARVVAHGGYSAWQLSDEEMPFVETTEVRRLEAWVCSRITHWDTPSRRAIQGRPPALDVGRFRMTVPKMSELVPTMGCCVSSRARSARGPELHPRNPFSALPEP